MPFSATHHPRRFKLRGERLTASGHVGAYSEHRGDWAYLQMAFGFEHYYKTNYCCHLCKAHVRIRRLSFTDFSRTAHVRSTRISNEDFLRQLRCARVVCPLIDIPGFNIWRVWADAMHTIDLGILQHALASALFELTETTAVWNASNRKLRLYKARANYTSWCAANTCGQTCPRFEEQALKHVGEYPVFTQRQGKASAVRAMQYWTGDICNQLAAHSPTEANNLRAGLFDNFLRLDVLTRRAPRTPSLEEAEAMADACESMLCTYNALAVAAALRHELLYKIIPKHHMCTHIFYDMAPHANPRRVHCYADEDMVGKVKKLVNACHGKAACVKAILRYGILIGLRWERQVCALRGVRIVLPRR